jgi:DNA polymerase-1
MAILDIFLTMFPGLKRFTEKGMLHLGKLIKSCIKAPPGWIFSGLDFASLEDKISALTTKDPNKLKVYTDGFDGHCLRAYAYFPEDMPDINPNSVESINSIKKKYPGLRQDSKVPTFALTYQGTWITLVKNIGFSEERAKSIETRYHILYEVSDKYISDKLTQAARDGYVTAAFGLRVRTPLLAQTIRGTKKTPHEAEAEGRSAGNALGQSWCLLNNRASAEFMGKVRKSKYRLDIRPVAFIHDAQYHLIRDSMEIVLYVNENLCKAVRWQEHPDIAHDQVKLGGNLSLFYPDWASDIELPEEADEKAVYKAIEKKLGKKT